MANTYVLISSTTLNSTTGTVTFSSIPSTYTDLVLRASARVSTSAGSEVGEAYFNNTSGNGNYSNTFLRGSGSAALSSRNSANSTRWDLNAVYDDAGNTANTFTNLEWYIANYTSSLNKSSSWFSVQENNSSAAFLLVEALYWSNTSAINSVSVRPQNFGSFGFVSGSSFYLYGIKNS